MSGFITTKMPDAFVLARRDYDRLRKRGWVTSVDNYAVVPLGFEGYVVHEIGEDFKTRVIGFITHPDHVKYVVNRRNSEYVRDNKLVRVKDLMDLHELRRRTGRSKSTLSGGWVKDPTFPVPVTRYGKSNVWLWPEVQTWMESKGLRVTRKESADGQE